MANFDFTIADLDSTPSAPLLRFSRSILLDGHRPVLGFSYWFTMYGTRSLFHNRANNYGLPLL